MIVSSVSLEPALELGSALRATGDTTILDVGAGRLGDIGIIFGEGGGRGLEGA